MFCLLVLLLFDSCNGMDIEKVKELKDVKDVTNIKEIKKIKSITPIDTDLALQMKQEIEKGKNLLSTFNEKIAEADTIPDSELSNNDLLDKVERILKLFNVDDLDDIVDVVKIKDSDSGGISEEDASNVIDQGYSIEDGQPAIVIDNSALNLLDSGAESDILNTEDDTDEIFEVENEIIRSIERKIKDILGKISDKKEILAKSKSMIVALTKMLVAEMRKIKTIEGVLEDHNKKIEEAQGDIKDLYSDLKDLQERKINHINKLQEAAQNKESESESLLQRIQDQASKIGSLGPLKINGALVSDPESIDIPDISLEDLGKSVDVSESEDSFNIGRRNRDSHSLKEIDRSKYNAYPLKKILSMKKIKSLTELSDEQAEKLLGLQAKRTS